MLRKASAIQKLEVDSEPERMWRNQQRWAIDVAWVRVIVSWTGMVAVEIKRG